MDIVVLGSTKLGYKIPREEIMEFAGKEANICYTKRTLEDIFAEPADDSIERAKNTFKSCHHSVADHVRINFGITGIPKILAMVLNNEGVYATSEKSARYTKMNPTPREQEKYDKWLNIFVDLLEKEYLERFVQYHSKMSPEKDANKLARNQITKLAQENARYMISVFTPTIMGHSIDPRQLAYECNWFEKFIAKADNTPFNNRLKESMREFVDKMSPYTSIEGLYDMKDRSISLFDDRASRYEQFGEFYCINYKASFAAVAQAQRHRTLRYRISFLPQVEFYIPRLIEKNDALKEEWLNDLNSLADVYPQGMLVMVNERGTYEDLLQKCSERLCGCAQLEIEIQTQEIVKRYVEAVKDKYPEIYEILLPYATKARCQNGWKCIKPCVWGGKEAFTRLC